MQNGGPRYCPYGCVWNGFVCHALENQALLTGSRVVNLVLRHKNSNNKNSEHFQQYIINVDSNEGKNTKC